MPVQAAVPPPRGALNPTEVASAAVLAAVALVAVLMSMIPNADGVLALTLVPFGVLARRHRLRAGVAALFASGILGGLLAGVGSAVGLAMCAVLGGFIGDLKRRGKGVGSVLLASVIAAPAFAGLTDLFLLVFSSYRRLTLEAVRAGVDGTVRTVEHVPLLQTPSRAFAEAAHAALDHWAITVAVAVIAMVVIGLLLSWLLLGTVLDRLRTSSYPLPWPAAAAHPRPGDGARGPAPLPVTLTGVGVRYPDSDRDALSGVDLHLDRGQFVVVLGSNGSGKSTLARVLAGLAPDSGAVVRGGPAGLGEIGGTAFIGQRPDAQVLGSRVVDDVAWGLPAAVELDVDDLLRQVGLAGLAERETSTLSGGQLQRLAVAASLARRPQLLISDESTAMLDPAGRAELIRLLAELTRTRAMSVVHITHNLEELAHAGRVDQIVQITDGRSTILDRAELVRSPTGDRRAPRPSATADQAPAREPVLVLENVSHYYALGTPWQHAALHEVNLEIAQGEGLLILGDNGSGKSTLAWIMAGLLRPSEGRCLVEGGDAYRQRGRTGLAFQHARLQVQRPTVAEDIMHAAGWPRPSGRERSVSAQTTPHRAEIAAALGAVGLEPALATRRIDQLSGGQLRRVALAGLLARRPRILILDEPLAGLDPDARQELVDTLTRLRAEQGIALIIISHDPQQLTELCPRTIRLGAGRVVDDTGQPSDSAPAASVSSRRRTRYRRGGVGDVLLRRLPRPSVLHRLWVGTKLLALAALTVATLLEPGWLQLAATAAVAVLAVAAARVPASAVPRLPLWLGLLLLIGFLLTFVGDGPMQYLRLVCLSALFLILSAVIAWTTALDEVAPAVRTLISPLRTLRVPVNEWVITIMLCVRSLPLLLDEARTLFAAHRQRPRQHQLLRSAVGTLTDVASASMAVTIRRANDMGEALSVRGASAPPAARAASLGWPDVLTLAVVAAACILPSLLG